jgi:Tfp pilus assembly protein PilO
MSRRDRIVVGVLVGAVAIAAFWFLALAPKRKAIAAADAQISTQQQRLDQAQQLLAGAQSAKRSYPANYAAVARLGQAVPSDDNMASLVYQLQSVADGAKVKFQSIKLGGTSTSGASSSASSTSTSSSAAAGTAAPASQVAASALPPGAVVGTAGLATLPFSFIFEGSYLDMQKFLARVDRFVQVRGTGVDVRGRLLTVDGISLARDGEGSTTVKATIAATAYLTPKDATADAAAASATASAGTTPGATASSSNTSSAVVTTPGS